MADRRIQQTKKVYVETDYDNIIVVNPNEIYDVDNNPTPRLVDHEDLVFYANLETFIIPRTKLVLGESLDSPVVNTTIATLFNGQDDLRLNFLQPKGKKDFDTSWSDQITGYESRLGQGLNQKSEEVVQNDGKPRFRNSVTKYEDTQMLGIKSISVNIKGTGVPEVNIEMVDVQGRALFEQGESSIYSAFFNFPYPLFYLTLKGYYGKAIRYRLSLLSFNSKFDAKTGNFEISLKLVGKFTALLFDTPLQYSITAPKMFNTEITTKDVSNNTVTTKSTYKGRQKLDEVYQIYKRKGMLDPNFPQISIEEFISRSANYAKKAEEDSKNKGDFSKLNDIADYRYNLSKLRESVYTNSINNFLDNSSYYVVGNLIYYPYKKEISEQTQKDYETKIQERIEFFTKELNKNATLGKGAQYEIPVDIQLRDVLKTLDFSAWLNNSDDIIKTYYYRTGRQIDIRTQEGQVEFIKFKTDEEKNAELFKKVLDSRGNIVEDNSFFYVFGDRRISDGTYEPNSFLDKIDDIEKSLNTNEEVIEKILAEVLADRALKNPNDGGLGFKPTIRNIFAIIFAGADAFYRLMEDVHQTAWDVRQDPARLNAVLPPDKNFSVDGKNSIQYSNAQLSKENVIYPWPLYFAKEKQADQRDLYVIQYPGDPKIIKQTRAYDYRIWPEIAFVEAYLKGTTETAKPVTANVYNNPADYSSYVSANAIEFPFKTPPYQDLASVPFFYELFERTYIAANYGKLNSALASKLEIDKLYGEIESKNVQLSIGDSIELIQLLKNYKFDFNSYIENLKKISNNGTGESWETYIRRLYRTQYLANQVNDSSGIYSIDTLSNRSIKISSDLPLSSNLKKYLENTETNKTNFLDTYPFVYYPASIFSESTILEFNDTTKVFVYLDDKKTIARINETEKYKNISIVYPYPLKNYNQSYISEENNVPVTTRNLLKSYYEYRANSADNESKRYLTEKRNSVYDYSGNTTDGKTTSLLNTPYFINSLLDGVEKQKNGVQNPYVALGYIFLNSLPFSTLGGQRINNIENDGSLTELARLSNTLKKYSAIHQLPYAWVLKYGSIWHRYKRFVLENVDILENTQKSFDYIKNYDPITSAITKTYVVPDYSGNSQNINLQVTEQFPNPSIQTKDIIGTGFYPNVINSVHYFVTGKDLFTGYTQNDFLTAYTENNFRIGKNNNATNYLNFGFDPQNPNRSLLKVNYYSYSEITDNNQQYVMVYPSMGGIPIDESIFECVNNNNTITIELNNNPFVYDGSVRTLWAAPNFGYIEDLNNIDPTQEYFRSEISGLDFGELFSIFDVKMLDEFEKKFLSFCNPNPTGNDLLLQDEIIDPTYSDPNKVKNLSQKRLHTILKSLFLVNKTGLTFVGEDTDGKTLGQKQIVEFTKAVDEFLKFDCVLKIGNPGKFDRLLFNSFSSLQTFVPEKDKLTFDPYVPGTLAGDGTNVTVLQSYTQNLDAWKTLRLYLGFSNTDGTEYQTEIQPEFPSPVLFFEFDGTLPAYSPPVSGQDKYTFQDLCTGQQFNITNPNDYEIDDNVTFGDIESTFKSKGKILFIESLDNSGNKKFFCAKKITNNNSLTTTYNYLGSSAISNNASSPEVYCSSYFQTYLNCPQSNSTNSYQLKLVGDSASIIPAINPNIPTNYNYINVVKPGVGYQVYKIDGDPNFNINKVGNISFYKNNSNINDNTNLVVSLITTGNPTNNTFVCEVNSNTTGLYQMVVTYYPNAPTNFDSPLKLQAIVSTEPVISNPIQQPLNVQQNVTPLQGSDKSYIADFFIDMNIAFTSENIERLAPLIRLYATKKLQDPTLNKQKFTTLIDNFLTEQNNLQNKILTQTLTSLRKNLKEVTVKTNETPSAVSGSVGKLTLYNTLKAFNDKWIAGSDLKYVTLFEDFLFMDRANSDIGDTYVVDIEQVIKRLDVKTNPDMNLMTVVSNILGDNQFMFFAMPAYINFYGLQQSVRNGKPIDIDIPNSLFGTYLEVDYTDSSPKFLCLYMGNPSEYPKPKENSFVRFDDDSFDLRIPDNPARVSDPKRDYSKTNRVVGFSVDFGKQNQSVFENVSLDMSEMKNTSESFKVFADIGSSVSGDKVAQQSTSMYSIYKSRSYSCGVDAFGNVMIQPTMYFVLRHIPLFYGPYWIYEVQHTVNETSFKTNFKGTRVPKYSLPNVDNLVINTNSKILQSYKQKIVTQKKPTEKETQITTDPAVNTTQSPTDKCLEETKYQTLPFVEISKTMVTLAQIQPIIINATSDTKLRALLMGLILLRPMNVYNSASTSFEIKNLNFYEISTENKFNQGMDVYLKEQVCIEIQSTPRVFASFTSDTTSTEFMVSFYTPLIPIIENLKTLNPDTNIAKSYGKALAQFAVTTWDTPRAFGPPLLSAQEIKDYVLGQYDAGNFPSYQDYVKIFTDTYQIFSTI